MGLINWAALFIKEYKVKLCRRKRVSNNTSIENDAISENSPIKVTDLK
jgi:hypothetical protein